MLLTFVSMICRLLVCQLISWVQSCAYVYLSYTVDHCDLDSPFSTPHLGQKLTEWELRLRFLCNWFSCIGKTVVSVEHERVYKLLAVIIVAQLDAVHRDKVRGTAFQRPPNSKLYPSSTIDWFPDQTTVNCCLCWQNSSELAAY